MYSSGIATETPIPNLTGLAELWSETLGDPRVCIAVLDGLADLSHPSLSEASLKILDPLDHVRNNSRRLSEHGTHVTSVIFGQHGSEVFGLAPRSRGLMIPIFGQEVNTDSVMSCSQADLARAITAAADAGALIINISGGQFTPSGVAHPLLTRVVERCEAQGVLIVAAVGNDGCECLHIPAAVPSVLAVGAMDAQGEPLDLTNWGDAYETRGILAPGENVLGASLDGGITRQSGTSISAAVVSGVAALLLSLQLRYRHPLEPAAIRAALLGSAVGCDTRPVPDCRRLLAGRLDLKGAMAHVILGGESMSNSIETQDDQGTYTQTKLGDLVENTELGNFSVQSDRGVGTFGSPSCTSQQACTNASIPPVVSGPVRESVVAASQGAADSRNLNPSAAQCGCGHSTTGSRQLVFALGQLHYDFGTEARRDSIMMHMNPGANNPADPEHILKYLESSPWDSASLYWTLNLDAMPIYAIQADGAYATEIYRLLRAFLGEQIRGESERVSIPGYLEGSVKLSTGQSVPVICPERRGMYSWCTEALIKAVCTEEGKREESKVAVCSCLNRIYEELRNFGVAPEDRALNYAATNALQLAHVLADAIKNGMELQAIEVQRSPICRPESECWDIKQVFFNPTKVLEQATKVCLFTVDVSDVVPVVVGKVRSWFAR